MEKPKIVVVEDNSTFIVNFKKVLEKAGYETRMVIVKSGDSAKTVAGWIKDWKPDMILMDEMLTYELHGYDVLKFLGGKFYKPTEKNPRVISISGAPSVKMLELVGGVFRSKGMLPHTKDDLLAEVARCASLIN